MFLKKLFVGYQQLTDICLHLSRQITRRKVSTLSERPSRRLRKHLDNIYNAIRQAPENGTVSRRYSD